MNPKSIALIALGFLLTSCVSSEPKELTLEVETSNEQTSIEANESSPALTDSTEEDCLTRDGAWYTSEIEDGYQWKYTESDELALNQTYGMVFGRCIDPSETEFFAAYKEGLGSWYFDLDGEPILEMYTFDNGSDYFVEGLARYRDEEKIGYIDERLNIIIPAQFDGAFSFEDGLAKVCLGCERVQQGEHSSLEGGKWGVVDAEGQVTWEEE